ncbi:MAG: glycosyltransferase [Acidobacteriota bacterium]
MRIVLVNKFLDNRGGDTTSVGLLRGWLEARGHEVLLFGTRPGTPSTNGSWAASPDADLFPPPLPSGGAVPARWAALYRRGAGAALERLIERRAPDLIHLHNIHYHLSGAVVAAARSRGVPVVWTLHDVNLFCPNVCGSRDGRPCLECHVARFHRCVAFNCRGSLPASLGAAAEAYLFRALGLWREIDGFICPSRFTRTLLEAHGVEAERIHVLEPALDLERFASPPEGGGGFLYVGRLAREKGVDVLIRAAGLVPQIRLRIAGDGPERASLERLATGAAPDRVRFLGQLPRPRIAGALAACDALVLPSVCMEVAPLAVLEAGAAARPAVASQVGGIPEWVEDGITGVLVPPGETEALAAALAALAAAPARARALGECARARVRERCQVAPHCDKLEGIYARVAAR